MVDFNPIAANPLMGINTLQLQQGQMHSQEQSMQRIERQMKEWASKKDVSQLSQSDADKLVAEHAKLQKAARDLEGVFVQQLLTAMDKTVDRTNSVMGGGQAESMFRDMMYENMATQMVQAPGGNGLGLADTIYRQMSAHLPTLPSATKALGGVQNAIKLLGEPAINRKEIEQSATELMDAPSQENPARQAEEESRKQAAAMAYQRASLPVTTTQVGGDHEP